jgi:hypothetical protein
MRHTPTTWKSPSSVVPHIFIADERPEAVVDHALKFFAEPARQADLR